MFPRSSARLAPFGLPEDLLFPLSQAFIERAGARRKSKERSETDTRSLEILRLKDRCVLSWRAAAQSYAHSHGITEFDIENWIRNAKQLKSILYPIEGRRMMGNEPRPD